MWVALRRQRKDKNMTEEYDSPKIVRLSDLEPEPEKEEEESITIDDTPCPFCKNPKEFCSCE